MTDHSKDVPPHTHGGTDAPECTTCLPTPRTPEREHRCVEGGYHGRSRCRPAPEPSAPDDLQEQVKQVVAAVLPMHPGARQRITERVMDVLRREGLVPK